VVSVDVSLATSDNCNVAAVTIAPGGSDDRSNFIRIAFEIL
jgi:hypothetical protein